MTTIEPPGQPVLLQDAVRAFNDSAPPVAPLRHWERPASGRPAAGLAGLAGLVAGVYVGFDREELVGAGPSGTPDLLMVAEPLEIGIAFGGAVVASYVACRVIQTAYRGVRRSLAPS
ncbi:MAG: hypothetical protein GY745_18880 [Actinomycetia bacterium]|nr:hypothetical protein [Actinomycetes bacterium]MCP4087088.1 hypothetical protein [Actinomycetes bacterium]